MQGLDIPTDIPDNDPGADGQPAARRRGWRAGGGGAVRRRCAPSAGCAGAAPGGRRPRRRRPSMTRRSPARGLPPLFSIPGAVLIGGIALAARRWQLARARPASLALGGAGACSHGLDSGLPDLRKA